MADNSTSRVQPASIPDSTGTTSENEDLFGGFHACGRTFQVRVRRLYIVRRWADPNQEAFRVDEKAENSGAVADVELRGKGHITDGDRVALIGPSKHTTNRLEVLFRPYASSEQHQRDWAELKRILDIGVELGEEEERDKSRTEFFERVFDQFITHPPTAILTYISLDSDSPKEGYWLLECWLPAAVFECLAGDFRVGQVRGLRLQVGLSPALIDDAYAPPDWPVTFGVVRRRTEDDDGDAWGWLASVRWNPVAPQTQPRPLQNPPVPKPAPVTVPDPREETSALAEEQEPTIAVEVRQLRRVLGRGFLILSLLLLLVLIFR